MNELEGEQCQKATYHGVGCPDDLEGVVHAAAGHLGEHLLNRLLEVPRADALGGPQLLGPGKLLLVDIDGDDARGPGRLAAHDHGEPNSSEAEDGAGGARFDLHDTGPAQPPAGGGGGCGRALLWALALDTAGYRPWRC